MLSVNLIAPPSSDVSETEPRIVKSAATVVVTPSPSVMESTKPVIDASITSLILAPVVTSFN